MILHHLRPLALACLLCLLCSSPALAATVSFGTGPNQFSMEFVTIGNPGNAADSVPLIPTGSLVAGSVGYTFQMGKYEVSRDMVTKASAAGLLDIDLGVPIGSGAADQPATRVSWNEAARYVNWLNTSQGYQAAYKFAVQPGEAGYQANSNIDLWESGDTGFDAANPFRNSLAHYWLPSVNEWHKAAYYDPGTSTYFDFPTGSNYPVEPAAVASGTAAGTAVYAQPIPQGPAAITQAGGLSPYGTMGQGGNVFEWEETDYDFVNDNPHSTRGFRGGLWSSSYLSLSSSNRLSSGPQGEGVDLGFRVAGLFTFDPADADKDGDVDTADLTKMFQNFTGDVGGAGGKTMADGDTDMDGDVDTADLTAGFQQFTGAQSAGLGGTNLVVTVPEPSSQALAALALAGLLLWRGRRQSR